MICMITRRWVLAVITFFILSSTAAALPMGYTDADLFMANLSGFNVSVLDFDGMDMDAGDDIKNGDDLDGITFSYDDLAGYGVSLSIFDEYDTVSPDNYLGTDDGGMFQGGEGFDILCGPVHAVGMYFISADPLLSGDITLSTGGLSVDLDETDIYQTLDDGSVVFFLGIIDPDAAFTSAGVTSFTDENGPYFLYNVDDIMTATAVPEPGTCLLFGLGLFAVTGLGFKKRKKTAEMPPEMIVVELKRGK